MSGTLIEVIKDVEQKNELWQWDTGRQIKITPEENAIVDEVHFSNAYSKDALVVIPQVNEQGSIVADIPNILLWQVFPINIYVVMGFPNGKGTIYEEQLKIKPRKKPSDYIYTETEVLNYKDLEERIRALEDGSVFIKEETDPTVPAWAKQPTKPTYTASEVGALPDDTKIPVVPTNLSEFENDTNFVSQAEMLKAIELIPQFKLVVVDSLPETGEDLTLYLVSKEGSDGDVYNEYVWLEQISSFEFIGTTAVDLTDYVKNTDYATGSVGGVIKTSSTFAATTVNGFVQAMNIPTVERYNKLSQYAFIGKGTLDALLTQYAKVVPLTQAEYDALEVKDPNTFYPIKKEV